MSEKIIFGTLPTTPSQAKPPLVSEPTAPTVTKKNNKPAKGKILKKQYKRNNCATTNYRQKK